MLIYPKTDMQRRKFVRNGLIFSISLTHVAQLFAFGTSAPGSSFIDDLLEFLQGYSISADLGKQFLMKTRQSSIDANALMSSLQASLSLYGPYSKLATLEDLLLERIAQDFEEDRLCIIENWSLSITECRLAGLKALTQKEIKKNAYNGNAEFLKWPDKNIAEIKTWGPRKTTQGAAFNAQLSEASALWIVTSRKKEISKSIQVYLGAIKLVSTVNKKGVITADLLPNKLPEIIDQPGNYSVYLVDIQNRIKQLIGDFKVVAGKSKAVKKLPIPFQIAEWGPRYGKTGQKFNHQSDDSSVWWLKFNGEVPSDNCYLKVGTLKLPTTINTRDSLMSARLNKENAVQILNMPSSHAISLHCGAHAIPLGWFTVE